MSSVLDLKRAAEKTVADWLLDASRGAGGHPYMLVGSGYTPERVGPWEESDAILVTIGYTPPEPGNLWAVTCYATPDAPEDPRHEPWRAFVQVQIRIDPTSGKQWSDMPGPDRLYAAMRWCEKTLTGPSPGPQYYGNVQRIKLASWAVLDIGELGNPMVGTLNFDVHIQGVTQL